MFSELVQLNFDKILQTHAYTVIILAAKEKRFAIYTEASVGKNLQLFLTHAEKPRPLTHDLFSLVLQGFEIRVKQIVINEVKDTIYYCRLFLEMERAGLREIVEIDGRPSDCIMLALLNNTPVYCTKEVLDQTIPILE
jgi:bifunctional DNase/RNase